MSAAALVAPTASAQIPTPHPKHCMVSGDLIWPIDNWRAHPHCGHWNSIILASMSVIDDFPALGGSANRRLALRRHAVFAGRVRRAWAKAGGCLGGAFGPVGDADDTISVPVTFSLLVDASTNASKWLRPWRHLSRPERIDQSINIG
jgi:hypothetical protein